MSEIELVAATRSGGHDHQISLIKGGRATKSCSHNHGLRSRWLQPLDLVDTSGCDYSWRFGRVTDDPFTPKGVVGHPWKWLGVAVQPSLNNDQCNASFVQYFWTDVAMSCRIATLTCKLVVCIL